jgi:hypothetical protein
LLNFLYLAAGLAVLAVALFLCIALHRLARALAALEETLMTTDEAIQEVTPELRDSLSSANDIAAGVNVALRVAGEGANRLTQVAARSLGPTQSTLHGVKVGAKSLLRSFTDLNGAIPQEHPKEIDK